MSITSTEHLVHLGLGSNLEDPIGQLRLGLKKISESLPVTNFECASFYLSPPMGGMEQPDYFNTVCRFSTSLDPHSLLVELRKIEDEQGRQRKEHWGARTLDIDILLFDQMEMNDPQLTIPHPGIINRDFVLVPLLELSPSLVQPQTGISYQEHLEQLKKETSLSLKVHHEGYL